MAAYQIRLSLRRSSPSPVAYAHRTNFHACQSNTFLSRILPCRASRALRTILRLISRSFRSGRWGFPTGCVMAIPGTILEAPTMSAVGTRVVMIVVGIPAFSISWLITAPQRVPVPQVAVSMAAETSSRISSAAMPLPILRAVSIVVATPVVV